MIALSNAQKQLLFLHETQGNPSLYNLYSAFEIKGGLSIPLLKEALKSVVSEQILLRAKILQKEGELYFAVQPLEKINFDLEIHQIQTVEEIYQEVSIPFDIYNFPLFRTKLFQVQEDHYIILFMMHHIIGDEWSFQILHRKISQFYNENEKNFDASVAKAIQRYALKETNGLKAFWKNALKNDAFVISLPYDYPRPSKPTFKGSVLRLEIPKRLSGKIHSLVSQGIGTLFTLVLTAVKIFLHKFTGQKEINIGIPSFQRDKKELLEIIGYFVNSLPINSVYAGSQSFCEFHKKIQSYLYQIKDHEDLSFNQIVQTVSEPGPLNINPIFQVWFALDDIESYDNIHFKGTSAKYIPIPTQSSKFDLSFLVKSLKGRLVIDVEYSTALFKETTIKKLTSCLLSFFDNLFEKPEDKLANISLLHHKEEEQIVNMMTHSSTFDIHLSVDQQIQQVANKYPDRIAIILENFRLTYRTLNECSDAIANYFRSLVKPQSIIGVSLNHSPFLIELLIGLMKSGMCFLPIDPNIPKERIAAILKRANSEILVSNTFEKNDLFTVLSQSQIETEMENEGPFAPINVPQIAMAYIIFTSGSTGEPKGVVVSRGNLSNALIHMNHFLGINLESRFLLNTTISFDISILELFATLMLGGAVVIPRREWLIDGKLLSPFLKHMKVNYFQATPSNWKLLIDGGLKKNPDLNILCGGEKLDPLLADKLIHYGKTLWNMYGPTETTIWSSYKNITSKDTITVGRPIGNTSIFILDADQQIAPPGIIGEITIGGKGVSQGYFNQPEMTVEKYFCNCFPFFPNSLMYKTGDRGKINEEGEILFLGREDRQVKIHGHRIELGE